MAVVTNFPEFFKEAATLLASVVGEGRSETLASIT
jgi:hypothetical protein